MDAVYEVEGNIARASAHAGGPWDVTMQHGGAPASLVAWAAERVPTATPMEIARVTLDLLRPVPVAPLEMRTEVVREGRKIQLVAIRLLAGGVEVVRASVLKIRRADFELPREAVLPPLMLPHPDECRPADEIADSVNPFLAGVEMRVAKGGFREPGPAAVWFRPKRPIVAGEAISPVMRAAVAADVCNGIAAVLDFGKWTFLNGDLTVNFARRPVGEWILVDAESWTGPRGAGVAFAGLADREGYFGRAVQSIVVDRR
jgi:hypothetical protein